VVRPREAELLRTTGGDIGAREPISMPWWLPTSSQFGRVAHLVSLFERGG